MDNRVSSILAADFGSVHTRVLLIDVVDGVYSVVTQGKGNTTTGYPTDDVSVGLQLIVSEIEQFTGRKLLNSMGNIITPEDRDRNGVDAFIVTASAGRPVRAVIVGLMPDVSLFTAFRAISGAYIEPVAEIHLRDGLSEEERLNAIILNRPDIIFISGGTDNGAQTALKKLLVEVERALKIADPNTRPILLYAGNSELAAKVHDMFGDLTSIFVANNIRPTMNSEDLESAVTIIQRAFDVHRERQGAGFKNIGEQTATGVQPTAQSYSLVAQYFAKANNHNVLTVDMGSNSTVLVGAFHGRVSTRISTTTGLGDSAAVMLDDLGDEAIREWLPYYTEADEIRNYALNKTVRPASIPMTMRETFLEHAFARAGLRKMVQNARRLWVDVEDTGAMPIVQTILAAGSVLTNTGTPAYDMMLIADALQPTGITKIMTDPYGVMAMVGAIARTQPDAAVQLLEGGNFIDLGTLVSIDGQPSFDTVVAKITLTTEDNEKIEAELKGGHVVALPVPRDFVFKVDIATRRGYTIGGKRRVSLELAGGAAGVVFDARGRNFYPPSTVEGRAELLPMWLQEFTEIDLPIPEDWLINPESDNLLDEMRSLEFAAPVAVETATEDDLDIFDIVDADANGDLFADAGDDETEDPLADLRNL